MTMPIWSLALLALALVVLLGVAISQHVRILCLRYCYHMTLYHTPVKHIPAALKRDAGLMQDAGMRPINNTRFEPHPFYEPE